MSKKYTLYELLEEIKAPKFEKGQFFEVLKSIYPNASINEEIKNIVINGNRITKPLACSSKAKKEFKKDKVVFGDFFKESTRGDFLEIIDTDGNKAICINRSLKEEVMKKYYNNESIKFITIQIEDVISGNIKRVYRGVDKYIYGGQL
jgi:hypothetical protein